MIHTWNKRQLTPLGKITVIKSMILSKLTYLFMNLPDPPVDFIQELQNVLYTFLWNGKPARIKRSVVCKPYMDGGLQMVDICTFISSLKISWMRRLWRDSVLQRFLFELYPDFESLSKLGEEFTHTCMKHCNNLFWLDVLKHFKRLHCKCRPLNVSEFMAECIHYNVNIIRDRRVVFIKEWVQSGILYINQLFNIEKGRFLSFAEFRERYPNLQQINFLVYMGIIHAIEQLCDRYDIELTPHYRVMEVSKVWMVVLGGSKGVKSVFLASNIIPSAVTKWNNIFDDLMWKKIFACCFRFQDVKLKWFQARVLHRLLPTKKFLYDCKITEDSVCTFCTADTQTIQHLLWNCVVVQTFWSSLKQMLVDNCVHIHSLTLSEELILFGVKHDVKTDFGFDYILVFAKFYIYKCYLKGTLPNVNTFLTIIKSNYLDIRVMASIEGNFTQFTKTWIPYDQLLKQ